MRRELIDQLPALTHFYRLKPWDVERLTFDELHVYVKWMNEYVEAQQRGR